MASRSYNVHIANPQIYFRSWCYRLLAAGLVMIFISDAAAGRLTIFEKSANRPSIPYSRPRCSSILYDYHSEQRRDISYPQTGLPSSVGNSICLNNEALGTYIAYSFERICGINTLSNDFDNTQRHLGEATIPFVRIDAAWQRLDKDLQASDYGIESGYGAFGLVYNRTDLRESNPADELIFHKAYAVLRLSLNDSTELDLGFGALTMEGDRSSTKPIFTMPLRFHPTDWFGMEFRPLWADRYSEYDAGILLGWRYVSAKAGYRWYVSPAETLAGPYLGFALKL